MSDGVCCPSASAHTTSAPGQVVARDQISLYALGRSADRYDRSIDTHISSLRKKLQLDQAGDAPAIRNLRGLGYVLAGTA